MSSAIYGVEQEPEKTHKWNCQRMAFQRIKSSLTHKQLADIIGVSHEQIECMEKCTSIPSKDILKTLVSFFNVPEDYFGVEALYCLISATPSPLSPQERCQQAAQTKLMKQRQTLRSMMKKAGFALNCTGLHRLAKAIDEPASDTCQYVNGKLEIVRKTQTWFASIPKTI